jgi:hypothetical protein
MLHVDLTFNLVYSFLIGTCGLGFLYGVYNWFYVLAMSTDAKFDESEPERKNLRPEQIAVMNETSEKINSVNYILIFRVQEHFFGGNISI